MGDKNPETVNIPSVKSSIREPSLSSQTGQSIKSLTLTGVEKQNLSPANGDLSLETQEIPLRLPENPLTPQLSPSTISPEQYKISRSPQRVSPLHNFASPTNASIISDKEKHINSSASPQSLQEQKSPNKSIHDEGNILEAMSSLEPRGKSISDHVNELTESIYKLTSNMKGPQTSALDMNIDKIAKMSKILTDEANALRQSIKSLSEDIVRTKKEIGVDNEENINFPYHLFLIELIVNKIHMKCECFDIDYNNLVIAATFLGKQPIVLYDPSYGKIDNFTKLNIGKSTLFAMTYDKICTIKEFEIVLQLTKQPPCSSCVTKIAETRMDYTKEFNDLRKELCNKWMKEQPDDNIVCTTSSPMSRNMYYLSCGDSDHQDSIGVIEVTIRMSFLGKEITTAFCPTSKQQGTSYLLKEDNGMTMYSCHKVEMDDQGKILLDEDIITKKSVKRAGSPVSQISSVVSSKRSAERSPVYSNVYPNYSDGRQRCDEIYTKMNANELKIRVPKSTKVERMGKYDKIQELCTCESTPYNTGEQIHFELPRDHYNKDKTYSSNLKYTIKGDRIDECKDRKIINVTPTNCPVPVDMEKMLHPQKDVFILKIGKKLETKDRKTDLEIELITPKAPSEKFGEKNNHISQQCSSENLKKKSSNTKTKRKVTKQKNKGKGKAKEKGKQTKAKKQKRKDWKM